MTTVAKFRDLIEECLGLRMPAKLRSKLTAALAAKPGRPRKADPVRVAALRDQGLSAVEIAAQLECHPNAVRRVIADAAAAMSAGTES